MQGKLIVFEGTDGSGKATQSELLCQELTRRGIPYRKPVSYTHLDVYKRQPRWHRS